MLPRKRERKRRAGDRRHRLCCVGCGEGIASRPPPAAVPPGQTTPVLRTRSWPRHEGLGCRVHGLGPVFLTSPVSFPPWKGPAITSTSGRTDQEGEGTRRSIARDRAGGGVLRAQ